LGSSKSICSVDIAWADGNQRQYTFRIETSTDGSSFSNVFSGKSKGTTSSPEIYSFDETQARYVRLTITQSHVGSSNSIVQISETNLYGKTSSASSTSAVMTLNTVSDLPESDSSATEGGDRRIIDDRAVEQPTSTSSDPILNRSEIDPALVQDQDKANSHEAPDQTVSPNSPPIAKNDRTTSESDEQILIKVLANDKDPDGDGLRVTSISLPPEKIGKAIINKDQTITFIPQIGLAGKITLSYEISDGSGGSDKAKIFILIKPPKNDGSSISESPDHESKYSRDQGELENDNKKVDENSRSTDSESDPPYTMETENFENHKAIPGNSTLILTASN
jgi:Big-like domain-containing protein/F5/8 type C domain-containing protein